MEIKTSAGDFTVTSYADGYPHFVTITHLDGGEIKIHHKELADIDYAVKRHRELLRVEAKHTDGNEI